MRAQFQKQAPITIIYRDYRHYNALYFHNELLQVLHGVGKGKMNYETFETIAKTLLMKHEPLKKKYLRVNNQPFMNKSLSKAAMTRTRLRNKFIRSPNKVNKLKYTKYCNYCTKLFRLEK